MTFVDSRPRDRYAKERPSRRFHAYMMTWTHSNRFILAAGACALAFSVAACSDISPDNIPPNASTGPGNAFSPGAGTGGSDQVGGGANTGFPSNGGGTGANAPGH